jgi:hypothetical protein
LTNQSDNLTSTPPVRLAPDFKKIRRYLRSDYEREMLDQFIKAGWSPAELGELARIFRMPDETRPAPWAYRIVVEWGPAHNLARSTLASLREPGYVMPPFDRPSIEHDDPENPEHTAETRADVEALARRFMARADDTQKRPRRGPEVPIPKKLWRNCYNHIKDFGGLECATRICRLRRYA